MPRLALSLVALLALAACSSTGPGDALDPLSQSLLRATSEVPAFGGVAFEGSRLVVYTLGAQPSAEAAVRALFGAGVAVEVRTRPERGQGSESLKDAVAALGVDGTTSVDYDETTGYVRLGVVDAESVRRSTAALDASALPSSEVIVQVERRVIAPGRSAAATRNGSAGARAASAPGS